MQKMFHCEWERNAGGEPGADENQGEAGDNDGVQLLAQESYAKQN